MFRPNCYAVMLKLAFATWVVCSSSLQAQIAEVLFSGKVLDKSNMPIAGAEVTFTAPSRQMWPHSPAWLALERIDTPKQTATTDGDGSYRVVLPTSNAQWLGPGDGVVLVRAANGMCAIAKYKLARGLVDQPMDIRMPNSTVSQLKLVDSSGKPVVNAGVSPARVNQVVIPLDFSHSIAAQTDDQGMVELPIHSASLEAVYVQGTDVGNQFLLVRKSPDSTRSVIVRSAAPRQLKCQWLDEQETKAIPKLCWQLISFNGSGDSQEFAWQYGEAIGTQAAVVEKLPAGSLICKTDAASGHGLFAEHRIDNLADDQKDIFIKLERGLHVVGKVVSLEDGQPLRGIALQSNGLTLQSKSNEYVVSDAQGNYELWLPKISDGCYPLDPFQDHFYSDAFFVSPGAESTPGEASIKPFELSSSAKVQGIVLDAQGQPVAGASVRFESKQERFVNTNIALSDRNGKFNIRGIAEGTPVKISVLDRRGITKQPIEVLARSSEPLEIRLSNSQPKQFVGRIVDDAGNPISGATVMVKRGVVYIPAGYNPAEYNLQNAFSNEDANSAEADSSKITTDDSGRFQSSDTVDWRGTFGLTVKHSEFCERETWLKDVSKSPPQQPQYDFGDVVLDRQPSVEPISIRVIDKNGQPLSEATVVLIQSRYFAGVAATNAAGQVNFQAKKTRGVIAVSHRLGTTFERFIGDKQSVDVIVEAEKCRQPWSFPRPDIATRRAALSTLLEKFELAKSLDFDKASEGEVVRILAAKVFADPASINRLLITKLPSLAKRGDIGLIAGRSILSRDWQLISTYSSLIPSNYKAGFFIEAAKNAKSSAERESFLDEAVQNARQSTGDEAATDVGRIAMMFLEANDIDTATELVREVYEAQQDDLKASTAQRSKRGVARYFLPQLALIDFEQACKLIHQHAYPNEIERLQTTAVTIAVMAKKTDWEKGIAHIGRNAFVASESVLVPGVFGETPIPTLEFAQGLSERIVDQRWRALWQILAAAKVTDATQADRLQWLSEGVQTLSAFTGSQPTMEHDMLATHLQPHIRRLAEIDPLGARRVVFECLRELSTLQDGQYFYLAERHAAVARLLAGLDAGIGKAMVEPFLSDLSWHYRAGARYSISPLSAASYLDPHYARSIVEKLIDSDFKEDKLRQAFSMDDFVDGLAK